MSNLPSNTGGVPARRGFKYQDHVAVGCLINALSDNSILEVQCERLDDISVIYENEVIEYIQVKTTDGNSKWNIKEITTRDKRNGKIIPETSLIEKSLLCDKDALKARFKVVSQRDLHKALKPITIPFEYRAINPAYSQLAKSISDKYKTTKSPNGNGLDYWINNALWEVAGTVEDIKAKNKIRLFRIAEKYGCKSNATQIEKAYEDLLSMAIDAADALNDFPDQKTINREKLMAKWEEILEQIRNDENHNFKPYQRVVKGPLVEVHSIPEIDIKRALTGLDVGYELDTWRAKDLAIHLIQLAPEVVLKASEYNYYDHISSLTKISRALKDIVRIRTHCHSDDVVAEILLHACLRQFRKSEPIACKIFYLSTELKCFANAHIIHGTTDELWLGKAKILDEANLITLLSEAKNIISDCLDPDFLKDERHAIIQLKEPNHLLPNTLNNALDLTAPINELIKILCIPFLIAYDSKALNSEHNKIDEHIPLIIQEMEELYSQLKENIKELRFDIKIHIFLFPLDNKDSFMLQFDESLKKYVEI